MVSPQISKACLDLGIGNARVDLFVEPVNNLGGRVLGDTNALETACLKAGYEITHSRDLWQRLRPRGGGHCERAQLASPHVLDRGRQFVEHHLHLTTY